MRWIDRNVCCVTAGLYTVLFLLFTVILAGADDVNTIDMTEHHWVALALWFGFGVLTIWSYVHAERELRANQPRVTRRF
jgi:uncharacterized membrane protein